MTTATTTKSSQDYGQNYGVINTYTKTWSDGTKIVYFTATKNGKENKKYNYHGNATKLLFA